MVGLYDYLDDFDRKCMLIEGVVDAALLKAELDWLRVTTEHEQNMNAIEMKVIYENGTDDDLTALYMAEATETTSKKRGIIGTIIDAILKLIKGIKNALFGTPDEKLPDDKLNDVKLNVDPNEQLKANEKSRKGLLDMLKGVPFSSVLKVGAVAGAGAVGYIVTAKTYRELKKKFQAELEENERAIRAYKLKIENADNRYSDVEIQGFKLKLQELEGHTKGLQATIQKLIAGQGDKTKIKDLDLTDEEKKVKSKKQMRTEDKQNTSYAKSHADLADLKDMRATIDKAIEQSNEEKAKLESMIKSEKNRVSGIKRGMYSGLLKFKSFDNLGPFQELYNKFKKDPETADACRNINRYEARIKVIEANIRKYKADIKNNKYDQKKAQKDINRIDFEIDKGNL